MRGENVSKTWKQVERKVAEIVGGVRVGCTGEATPDVVARWLAIEVKHRAKVPQWLTDAVAQARANSSDSQLGIVVIHEKGKRTDRSLVLLNLQDFVDWFGDLAEVEQAARWAEEADREA